MARTLVNIALGVAQILLGLRSDNAIAKFTFIALGGLVLGIETLQKRLSSRARRVLTVLALFPFVAIGILCGGLGIAVMLGTLASGNIRGLLLAIIYFAFTAVSIWIVKTNLKNYGSP